jgi:hypothetical protein
MTRLLPLAILCLLTMTVGPLLAQTPGVTDSPLGRRALTDADLEKYIAVLTRVTQANKARTGRMTPAVLEAMNAAKATACEEQGWTTLDYSAVDTRMMTAQMYLKMPALPVAEDKKADVAIAKKFQERIEAARK